MTTIVEKKLLVFLDISWNALPLFAKLEQTETTCLVYSVGIATPVDHIEYKITLTQNILRGELRAAISG